MGAAGGIDVAEVRLAVEAVVALRGEDEPARVRRPGVIGVALGAVDGGERVGGPGLEVEHAEVGLGVPDGEGAVVGHGVEQPPPVGADAGVADGALRPGGRRAGSLSRRLRQCRSTPDDGIHPLAEAARPLVEGDAHQGVLQAPDVARQADGVGGAVVDVAAVGRERREGLEHEAVGRQRRRDDAALLQVGHVDVAARVEHLEPPSRVAVEGGDDLLRRVSDVPAGRREPEVDAAGDAQLLEPPLAVEDGPAARAAHVHHRQTGRLAGVGMAVHAAVVELLVVADGPGVERLQAALLDAYLVPYLVVGLDEAVGQVGVYLLLGHGPAEGPVLPPLAGDEGGDGDLEAPSRRLLHQLAPVVGVERGLAAPGADGHRRFFAIAALAAVVDGAPGPVACPADAHLQGLAAFGAEQEVERRDVAGDGHVAVVGIDGRLGAGPGDVLRRRGAGGEQ